MILLTELQEHPFRNDPNCKDLLCHPLGMLLFY